MVAPPGAPSDEQEPALRIEDERRAPSTRAVASRARGRSRRCRRARRRSARRARRRSRPSRRSAGCRCPGRRRRRRRVVHGRRERDRVPLGVDDREVRRVPLLARRRDVGGRRRALADRRAERRRERGRGHLARGGQRGRHVVGIAEQAAATRVEPLLHLGERVEQSLRPVAAGARVLAVEGLQEPDHDRAAGRRRRHGDDAVAAVPPFERLALLHRVAGEVFWVEDPAAAARAAARSAPRAARGRTPPGRDRARAASPRGPSARASTPAPARLSRGRGTPSPQRDRAAGTRAARAPRPRTPAATRKPRSASRAAGSTSAGSGRDSEAAREERVSLHRARHRDREPAVERRARALRRPRGTCPPSRPRARSRGSRGRGRASPSPRRRARSRRRRSPTTAAPPPTARTRPRPLRRRRSRPRAAPRRRPRSRAGARSRPHPSARPRRPTAVSGEQGSEHSLEPSPPALAALPGRGVYERFRSCFRARTGVAAQGRP